MRRERIQMSSKLFDDFDRAFRINSDNLKIILSDNKSTDFGIKHQFKDIQSEEDYRSLVPLSKYCDYDGIDTHPEKFTCYPINYTLSTSGSTGKQKLIPLSKEALERYSDHIHYLPYLDMEIYGPILHTSVFRPAHPGKPTILSSAYFGWLRNNDPSHFENFVGGEKLLFADNIKNIPYLKTWLIFACQDISAIQSIYLYDLMTLLEWIKENWKDVLEDMKNRHVWIKLDKSQTDLLLSMIPDAERISEIEHIMQDDCGKPFLPRLLKNLRMVCGISGCLYELQEQQLRESLGEIPIHYFCYAMSECIIGVARSPGLPCYNILPESAYYEFLGVNDNIIHDISELKDDELYEPVITTFSGLYRYKTGDIIQVDSYYGESPCFRLVGKRELLMDIAGEKISVVTASMAIKRFCHHYGINSKDYAISINVDIVPNGYRLFLETDYKPKAGHTNRYFDQILKELSPDYEDLRQLGLISMPEIYQLDSGIIALSHHKTKPLAHSKPEIFANQNLAKLLLERSIPFGKQQ